VRRLNTEERQQQAIEWRKSRVLELSSEGYSQREIAQKLQLDKSTVNRDIQFLRQQAQENLQHHIHEVVPEEYQKCMVGMKQSLKHVLEIAETATDPKTKLQARAIANDCYKFLMEMSTNAGIVSDALKFVNQSQQKINTMQKQTAEETETEETEGIEAEEEKTTKGVY
jgi:DNA-binding transcriptional regulator LsrR (DeoR family)